MNKKNFTKSQREEQRELIALIPKDVLEELKDFTYLAKSVLGACIQLYYEQDVEKQGYFHASQRELSEMVKASESSCKKVLERLRAKGLIKLEEKGGFINGKKQANRWNFLFKLPTEEFKDSNETEELYNLIGKLHESINNLKEENRRLEDLFNRSFKQLAHELYSQIWEIKEQLNPKFDNVNKQLTLPLDC